MDNQEEMLIKEAKSIQAEYHRNWTAKNRDKVKETNKRYWLNKAKKKLEEQKGW